MKNNNVIITILLIIVVGAGSFYAGTKYQESQRSTFARQTGSGSGQRFNVMGNKQGLRPVQGEVIAVDNNSITVKLSDGGSKIVLFSDKTTINKASEAAKTDIKNGEKVAVFGQENTDGTVTAQNIQLNPTIRSQTIQNLKQ